MFATVSIQTYNRAETLATTLESLRALRCPKGVDYEILVVDNNSSDYTPEVIRRYATILAPRLRSVSEPRQGLSRARNRGLREARGEIVCFIDDDVKVDPGWLEAVSSAFTKHSATVVGGRSYLIYPTFRPEWLPPTKEFLLSRLDHGDEVLVNTNKQLFGLNLSVLRQAALEVRGFNAQFGRNRRSLASGEEADFLARIKRTGAVVVYEPEAVVGHMVPFERITKTWLLRRSYVGGVNSIQLQITGGGIPQLGESLMHSVRCCGSVARTMLLNYTTAADLFEREIDAMASLGALGETVKHAMYRALRRMRSA